MINSIKSCLLYKETTSSDARTLLKEHLLRLISVNRLVRKCKNGQTGNGLVSTLCIIEMF